MKNNFKALIIHWINIILSTIFLIIFVITGPIIGHFTTNIIFRLFISMAIFFIYFFTGTFLDKGKSKYKDFLTGCFVSVVGLIIWFYTFSITGKNLFEIPEEVKEYWLLMNIYNAPFTIICMFLSIPFTPLVSLIINFLPTLLLGLGLKYKRLKRVD